MSHTYDNCFRYANKVDEVKSSHIDIWPLRETVSRVHKDKHIPNWTPCRQDMHVKNTLIKQQTIKTYIKVITHFTNI